MVLELCLVHAFESTLLQKGALLPDLPHMLVLMELKLLESWENSELQATCTSWRTLSHFESRQTGNETLTDFFYFKTNVIKFNHFILNVSYMYLAKLGVLEQCYFLRHPDKT